MGQEMAERVAPAQTSAPAARARGRLVQLLFGLYPAQVMHALVDVAVPELLDDELLPVATLAARASVDPAALRRLLRAGVALGLLSSRSDQDAFALTAEGRLLMPDEPGSIRNLVLLWGGEPGWRSWGRLSWSVRTGCTAYDEVMGASLFERHTDHPDEQQVFDQAMAESSRVAARGVVDVLDVGPATNVVDVGGGTGSLLATILQRHATLHGTVFDRPTNADRAIEVLGGAGVADRAQFVGGDFFDAVPAGADLYLLKSVLHDWDDEDSLRILGKVREVMRPTSRLCVVEPLVPEDDEGLAKASMTIISDLNMLVCTGGAERTRSEMCSLLARSGFDVIETVPCQPPNNLSLVHAAPR